MTERNRSCKFRATNDNPREAAGRFVTLSMRRVHKVRALTMISAVSLSEADILDELIRPDDSSLSVRVAEELLAIGFSSTAKETIRGLLQKNNSGTITDAEKETLQNYTRVGQFLDLLQAKARLSLMQSESSL